MPELSTVAKAVQAAPNSVAVLRVIAEQLAMQKPFGNTDADAGVFAAHQAIHAELMAVAAELEAQ